MTGAYRVPLRDVLEVDCLSGTSVVAGVSGLDRVVTRLNVMEVPDIVDWVSPHGLLVTTGYPLDSLPADPHRPGSAFAQLIRNLDARGTAALGIKIGRYLDAVPPDVLDVADELGFPVLSLPADMAFDDLLEQVHLRLSDVQAGVLERTDALHAALEGLVLEGGGLEQIATEIASVLSIGVLFTSVDGRERASALSDAQRVALQAAELFEPTGRFRIERLGAHPVTIGPGQVQLHGIAAGGSDLARLVSFSPGRHLPQDDVHALQRAATVAALLITQQQAISAIEGKYRGDFLRDVLTGQAGDDDFINEYADGLGWNLHLPGIIVSAELDPPTPGDAPVSARIQRSWHRRFFAAWGQVVAAHDRSIPSADFSDEVVTLLSVPEALRTDPAQAMESLRRMVERIVASVAGDKGGGRRPFSVGASRLVWSLDGLPEAYRQARRATEVGRRVNGVSSISHFDQLGIHRLIGLIPDGAELTAFAADVLRELAADTPEALALRTTLQVLLDTNLNVAEASRIQFFHYNTMRYRLRKLESILGPFTTDAHLRLNIAVALQVRQIQR